MRAIVLCLTLMAATLAPAAQPSETSPIHLRGYYRLYNRNSVWQYSDGQPWYIVKDAPWADPRLVKWGYVPAMHDGQRYYCLVDHDAPTGSRIPEWLFACGDPATAELLYNSNRTPLGLLYGGPR
jgi:hypothetical protein